MAPELAAWLVALGRVLLGGLFVFGGVSHFFLLGEIVPVMAARGVPWPRVALICGSLFQLAMGLLLMLGIAVPVAAVALVVFTIAASLMMVDFWNKPEPERTALRNVFLTNLAVIGGLLIAAGTAA